MRTPYEAKRKWMRQAVRILVKEFGWTAPNAKEYAKALADGAEKDGFYYEGYTAREAVLEDMSNG